MDTSPPSIPVNSAVSGSGSSVNDVGDSSNLKPAADSLTAVPNGSRNLLRVPL